MDRFVRRLRRCLRKGPEETAASVRYRAVSAAALALFSATGIVSFAAVVFRADPPALSGVGVGPNAGGPPDSAAVLAWAEAETVRRPADPTPWLTMAWIQASTSTTLTPSANAALLRSYQLAPLGPEVTLWRLAFIFDHWSSASPAVRASALRELRVVYPQKGWDIEALARTAVDPTGRMIATLASKRLRTIERLDTQGELRRP